jgi:CysZ protein
VDQNHFYKLLKGAGYFFRGLKSLTHSSVAPSVLIPLLINGVLCVALLVYLYVRFNGWVAGWLGWLPSWTQDWLKGRLLPYFFLFIQGGLIFLLSLMANLLAGAFNSLLAERVEMVATGEKPPLNRGFLQAALNFFPSLFSEMGKITYFLVWTVPLG